MNGSHTHSLEQIKDMLLGRVEDVAMRYAPAVAGSYRDRGKWFTLNPGRVDNSVGSFYVQLDGARAGRFHDFATGQDGDILDLIALSLNCSLTDAIREARSLLGLQADSHESRRLRELAAARAKARREGAAADEARKARAKAKQAHAIWLSGRADISGTPVDHYLRGRAIDLAALPRTPRALRFVPDCFYTHTDPETGEVIEGRWPAMVALAVDGHGRAVACHRTYLAHGSGGWAKAPVPVAKKILGAYRGASVHVWRGTVAGPRGGEPPPLSKAPPGTRVYVTEGIEDALSVSMIVPSARIVCAMAVGNLAAIALPPAVTAVTLVADRDEGPQAQAALDKAREAHLAAGRSVAIWQNRHGGKDMNDALRAAMAAGVPMVREGAA